MSNKELEHLLYMRLKDISVMSTDLLILSSRLEYLLLALA